METLTSYRRSITQHPIFKCTEVEGEEDGDEGGVGVFLVGRRASLASVRGPMTRFLAFSIAVSVLAFSACEKHPLPGETAITTVPSIDGFAAEHGGEHGKTEEHAKKDEHAAPANEKKEGASAPAEAKQ
jgi:hypothetical protein